MQLHTRTYINHFGYGEQDFIPCEACHSKGITKEARSTAHLIHRGMGGSKNPKINEIENLMALCGSCHRELDGRKAPDQIERFRQIHFKFLDERQRSS